VGEEIIEEGPMDLLTLDIVETCHRLNSLCAMIIDKYSFSNEEDFQEMHHVEDPLDFSLSFVLFAHDDKGMIDFSHIDELSYDILILRWIDQACECSFQHDFLPPAHLHEFHFSS
jgi:hypothetical protein